MANPELLKFYPLEHLVQLPKNNRIRRQIEKMAQLEPRPTEPDRMQTIGYAPPQEAVIPQERNLDAIWQIQSQNFLRYNFHIERGFLDTKKGKKAYLDTLPHFEPRPEEYNGRLEKTMLIERKIPWQRQAELAHIALSPYLQSRQREIRPWKDNPHQIPDGVVAYTAYFNEWGEGDFPDPIKPFDAREQLRRRIVPDIAGADPYEAVAQEIHHPEDTASGKYFDIIGYSVGSDYVVCLRRWRGGPGLHTGFGDVAHPGRRPLVRGSKIVTWQLAA